MLYLRKSLWIVLSVGTLLSPNEEHSEGHSSTFAFSFTGRTWETRNENGSCKRGIELDKVRFEENSSHPNFSAIPSLVEKLMEVLQLPRRDPSPTVESSPSPVPQLVKQINRTDSRNYEKEEIITPTPSTGSDHLVAHEGCIPSFQRPARPAPLSCDDNQSIEGPHAFSVTHAASSAVHAASNAAHRLMRSITPSRSGENRIKGGRAYVRTKSHPLSINSRSPGQASSSRGDISPRGAYSSQAINQGTPASSRKASKSAHTSPDRISTLEAARQTEEVPTADATAYPESQPQQPQQVQHYSMRSESEESREEKETVADMEVLTDVPDTEVQNVVPSTEEPPLPPEILRIDTTASEDGVYSCPKALRGVTAKSAEPTLPEAHVQPSSSSSLQIQERLPTPTFAPSSPKAPQSPEPKAKTSPKSPQSPQSRAKAKAKAKAKASVRRTDSLDSLATDATGG